MTEHIKRFEEQIVVPPAPGRSHFVPEDSEEAAYFKRRTVVMLNDLAERLERLETDVLSLTKFVHAQAERIDELWRHLQIGAFVPVQCAHPPEHLARRRDGSTCGQCGKFLPGRFAD